ncbi:NAD(P)/FAD-dependent oxidoreductase [Lysobacter korlensis]|uniref:Protein CbrA n=1 Tax=Lysobacter korlensis TaxID=553636 RepID=A0ABV6RTG3_9GAMM
MTVDVGIVGGGPVGLAAAIEARRAGLSVTLIEQRDGTIDKACGEGLMPGALPLLGRLGVDPPGVDLNGVRYRDGARIVDHRFTGLPGRGVRRTTLHRQLAERAEELGVQRLRDRVTSVEQRADRVVAAGIAARWLLGCDGLHSTVARRSGLALPPRRGPRRFGIRRHYALEPWSDLIEVIYAADVEFYVTPVGEREVGVAMLGPMGSRFEQALAAVPSLAERLAGAPVSSSLRGAGPFRSRTRSRTNGRVLLVGDAAGYVDALTGEGLRLGFALARAAVEAIASGQPEDYEDSWRRETRAFRTLTTGLVTWATSPARGLLVPTATRMPALFGAAVDRLAR